MLMKIFVITILLVISSGLYSPSWANIYSEEIEQTISFDNVYDIFIDNVDGDIEIQAIENLEEISVKVTKQIDALDKDMAKNYCEAIEIKQLREKDRIILKTEVSAASATAPDALSEGIFSARVNYHIGVIQDIAVVIRNGRGNVRIEGITGAQDIGTTNGTVELIGVLGQFQVTVIKGSIKGKIWLNGESAFSTTNGLIDLEILDTLSFPLTLETTDGDINLRLPSEYSADLEAQCKNGKVISEIPLTIEKQKSASVLRGNFNDGGPLLKLNASNGDITIQEIGDEWTESPEKAGTLPDVEEMPSFIEEPGTVDRSPSRPVDEETEEWTPDAEVAKSPMSPLIDGTLNERVWRNATRLSDFYLADGEPAYEFSELRSNELRSTEAYLLWDEDNFYIGVKAYDPQMHRVKISQTEFDSPVWEDDDIELLIDPNPQTQNYYHIAVNPIGTVFDQQVLRRYEPKRLGSSVEEILHTDRKNNPLTPFIPLPKGGRGVVKGETDVTWSSHCVVGTEIYPDFWSVEIAIPLESVGNIPSPSAQWSFNIHRKVHAQQEYIYWSPTYASDEDASWPHFPERFGRLRFVEERTVSAFESSPEQIRLDRIEIKGNENISDTEILSIIGLKPSGIFNPEEITAMRQTLEETGWFSKVITTYSFSEDSSTLFIEVVENPYVSEATESDEGSVSFVKSLKIHGGALFTSQQLTQYFNLKAGRIVTDQISTKCRLIGELYHNRGYPLASAGYRVADGTLDITIDEGRIKQIQLLGNKRVKQDEVIKLLDISEGDVYISDTSEEQIFRMAAKLKRENSYFSTLTDWKLDSKQKTLSIEIEEKPIGGIKPHPIVNFNRVHGLMLGGGAQVTTLWAGGGRLYGRGFYGISSENGYFQLGAEKRFFNQRRFTVGAQVHKLTDTNDLDLLSTGEDFLASVLFGDGVEDYFQRKGYEAWLTTPLPPFIPLLKGGRGVVKGEQQLTPSMSISVRYADDKYSSLFIENDWSLFYPSMPKRGNPRIDDGKIRSITVSYEFDSRNVKQFATRNFHTYPVPAGETQNGWQGYFSMEYAGRKLKGDFDFTLYKFYLTRYNRLSSRQTFDFRITGALSDELLPAQRLSYLGGIGTLRGYEFKRFMGDNMFLLNVEYRLRFRRSSSSAIVAFVDSGYTFQHEEEIDLNNVRTSAGIGLQIGDDIRIDVAQPLEADMGPALMLRLERMF